MMAILFMSLSCCSSAGMWPRCAGEWSNRAVRPLCADVSGLSGRAGSEPPGSRSLKVSMPNECVPEAGMRLHDKFNDTRVVGNPTTAPQRLFHPWLYSRKKV